MWLLYALWLVDCAVQRIIFSLEMGFILRPHCKDDLDGLAQAFQALVCAGIGIAVGQVFVFVPACAYAEDESSMTDGINGRGHFRQQGWIAIAVACDQLPYANSLRIASQRRCACPALERNFLCRNGNGMKVVVEPDRGIAKLIGLLRDTRHGFVSLCRIGDTDQVHTPSLRNY